MSQDIFVLVMPRTRQARCPTLHLVGALISPSVSKGGSFISVSVLSSQRNREIKLNYFGKLIENNNVTCLQEEHGNHKFLQAIQVFRLFGTIIPGNENARGSAICIHKAFLPEGAIVSHVITCEGRDHFVYVQSGRKNSVIVNVHFEPELTLRR